MKKKGKERKERNNWRKKKEEETHRYVEFVREQRKVERRKEFDNQGGRFEKIRGEI